DGSARAHGKDGDQRRLEPPLSYVPAGHHPRRRRVDAGPAQHGTVREGPAERSPRDRTAHQVLSKIRKHEGPLCILGLATEGPARGSQGCARDATTAAPNPLSRGLRSLRAKRTRVILFVILVGILAVLAALRTDLVRIGPSSVTLPEQALRLSVTWYRLGDIDPDVDHHRFWI